MKALTPNNQAKLYTSDPLPTSIFGLIALIRPGIFGGTDTRTANAALQFFKQQLSRMFG